jgi:hypothetical protein
MIAGCGRGGRNQKPPNRKASEIIIKLRNRVQDSGRVLGHPDNVGKPTKQTAAAILAVGAAVVALYLAFGRPSEKISLETYEVLGAGTAEETAKLLDNKGRVLVMVRDTGPDKNPSVEAELKAFRQILKKHADLSLIVERVQVTPTLMMSTGGGLPADLLFKALETHGKVDVVVLFFGFPQLTDPELAALKKTGAKTVVVSSFRPGYQRLLERQAIHLAIVPRTEVPSPSAQAPQTVRERFDQEYLVVTSAGPSPAP